MCVHTGVIIFPRFVELELQVEERLHPAERGRVRAADVGRRFPRVVDVAIGIDVVVVLRCGCGRRRDKG